MGPTFLEIGLPGWQIGIGFPKSGSHCTNVTLPIKKKSQRFIQPPPTVTRSEHEATTLYQKEHDNDFI